MATTARVFVWAARGNRTVDVRRLGGPRHGQFVPPPYLAAHASRGEYDLAERADRDAAYELLLSHGTAEDITGWVNLDLLAGSFDGLRLAPHVAGPWRQALRDLRLLAGDASGDVSREVSGDVSNGASDGVSGDLPGDEPGRAGERPDPTGNGTGGNHRPTVPAA